jgi:hypothetical protein
MSSIGLTNDDVDFALKAAKKSLTADKRASLVEGINAAFEDYLSKQSEERQRPKGSHKQRAEQLHGIAKKAAALVKAAGFANKPSGVEELARQRLERVANVHGKEIGGYPGLESVIVKYGAPRMDYRGAEWLSLIFGELKLLEQLALRAQKAELKHVRKSGNQTGWERDALLDDIINAWKEAFGEKPRASINSSSGEAGGPFVRFVQALPARLPKEASPLTKALTLSPAALREIVRGRKYNLPHGRNSR